MAGVPAARRQLCLVRATTHILQVRFARSNSSALVHARILRSFISAVTKITSYIHFFITSYVADTKRAGRFAVATAAGFGQTKGVLDRK
jgi:hypothetical protein